MLRDSAFLPLVLSQNAGTPGWKPWSYNIITIQENRQKLYLHINVHCRVWFMAIK